MLGMPKADTPFSELKVRALKREEDWYLLQVAPNMEEHAVQFLQREEPGCTIWYPVARKRRTIRHLEHILVSPAFGGYLYARFVSEPCWQRMRECRSTPRLVPKLNTEGYLWERNRIVAEIIQRAQNNEFDHPSMQTPPCLSAQVGEHIRIPYGLLSGYIGRVKRIHGGVVIMTVQRSPSSRPLECQFPYCDIVGQPKILVDANSQIK